MKPKILLIEDEEGTRFGFTRYLSKRGYIVTEARCLSDAREAFLRQRFDAVLLDLKLPDGNGIDWITEVRGLYPDMPVIVITGFGDIPLAVEAMRRGAYNFLPKPVNMGELDVFLSKSLELGTIGRRHLTDQRFERKGSLYFGASTAMKEIMHLASVAAKADSPVLISGETGSGKGILARWIHEQSFSNRAPFVEVNCSNLKGELLASELFGHARGAFTTAVQEKQGLIEVSDGGTLFLDEIGDMDPGVQAQFLKVIEEKQYRRLGEVRVRRSEFRLICATNQDLPEMTRQGRFRKDLYFRINVLSISIPPLRARPEDIPGFILAVLKNLKAPHLTVSSKVIKLLQNYAWPGNIRELRNIMERAVLLAHGKPLTTKHFSSLQRRHILAEHEKRVTNLEEIERAHIRSVINSFDGEKRKAAEALNISRATLYRKLRKLAE